MAYKFIEQGIKKFTAIAKAIKTWTDYDEAVAEAESTGKPYFLEFEENGANTRSIAWANKTTGKVDKGAWSHTVPTSIPELEKLVAVMPLDKPTSVFKLAYDQYCIKMDALAVKPKGAGAGFGKEVAYWTTSYNNMIVAGKTHDEIETVFATLLIGMPFANKVFEALKMDTQFS